MRVTNTDSKTDDNDLKKQCLELAETNRGAGTLIAEKIKGISDRPFLESLLIEVEYIDTYGGATSAVQEAINNLDQQSPEQNEAAEPDQSVKRRPAKRGRSPENLSSGSTDSNKRYAKFFDENTPSFDSEIGNAVTESSNPSAINILKGSLNTISNFEIHELKTHLTDDQKNKLGSLKEEIGRLINEISKNGESEETSQIVEQLSIQTAKLQQDLFKAQGEAEASGLQSHPLKEQIKELKDKKNQELVGQLLDQCTASQRENLSNYKKFPKHCWPAMNIRLVADKLKGYVTESPGGLFRKSGTISTIDSVLENFTKKRVPDGTLSKPIELAHLFKKTHESRKLFIPEALQKFTAAMNHSQNKDQVAKELESAINTMGPDDKDRLKINLDVMRYAYQKAPEKASNHNSNAPVAKDDLAKFFAECAFKYQDIDLKIPRAKDEIMKAQKAVKKEQAQGTEIMKVLLTLPQKDK